MRKLLSANLMRLGRSRTLWFCMAYALYESLMVFYNATVMARQDTSRWAPSFQFLFPAGIFFAIYCSFFISGEYADGGIRRKLMVGAPRPLVYLASFASCTAASLLICGVYILTNWPLEYFLVGPAGGLQYTQSPSQTALLLVEMVFAVASFNAIFTMIGMNVQHKVGGPVAVLVTAAALIYFGHDSRIMLLLYNSSPEMYRYSPLAMLRYKLFAEWLPGGQALHCVDLGSFWTSQGMILRSFIVIVVSGVIGMALFQRKDLK